MGPFLDTSAQWTLSAAMATEHCANPPITIMFPHHYHQTSRFFNRPLTFLDFSRQAKKKNEQFDDGGEH